MVDIGRFLGDGAGVKRQSAIESMQIVSLPYQSFYYDDSNVNITINEVNVNNTVIIPISFRYNDRLDYGIIGASISSPTNISISFAHNDGNSYIQCGATFLVIEFNIAIVKVQKGTITLNTRFPTSPQTATLTESVDTSRSAPLCFYAYLGIGNTQMNQPTFNSSTEISLNLGSESLDLPFGMPVSVDWSVITFR
jgi:hypothetical protein